MLLLALAASAAPPIDAADALTACAAGDEDGCARFVQVRGRQLALRIEAGEEVRMGEMFPLQTAFLQLGLLRHPHHRPELRRGCRDFPAPACGSSGLSPDEAATRSTIRLLLDLHGPPPTPPSPDDRGPCTYRPYHEGHWTRTRETRSIGTCTTVTLQDADGTVHHAEDAPAGAQSTPVFSGDRVWWNTGDTWTSRTDGALQTGPRGPTAPIRRIGTEWARTAHRLTEDGHILFSSSERSWLGRLGTDAPLWSHPGPCELLDGELFCLGKKGQRIERRALDTPSTVLERHEQSPPLKTLRRACIQGTRFVGEWAVGTCPRQDAKLSSSRGYPIDSALLRAADGTFTSWNTRNGRLESGTYTLQGIAKGPARRWLVEGELVVDGEDLTLSVNREHPADTVQARLLDDDGRPLGWTALHVYAPHTRNVGLIVTRADGSFEAPLDLDGRVRLALARKDRGEAMRERDDVPSRILRKGWELPAYTPLRPSDLELRREALETRWVNADGEVVWDFRPGASPIEHVVPGVVSQSPHAYVLLDDQRAVRLGMEDGEILTREFPY